MHQTQVLCVLQRHSRSKKCGIQVWWCTYWCVYSFDRFGRFFNQEINLPNGWPISKVGWREQSTSSFNSWRKHLPLSPARDMFSRRLSPEYFQFHKTLDLLFSPQNGLITMNLVKEQQMQPGEWIWCHSSGGLSLASLELHCSSASLGLAITVSVFLFLTLNQPATSPCETLNHSLCIYSCSWNLVCV